jgi:hypothetical protein
MSSEEFLKHSKEYKTGKNIGRRAIEFTGCRKDKKTGKRKEYILEQGLSDKGIKAQTCPSSL